MLSNYHFIHGKQSTIHSDLCYSKLMPSFYFSNTRIPFEWKTPLGYLLAVAFECSIVLTVIFTAKSVGIYGIGLFSFSIALTEDIKCDLDAIATDVRNKQTRSKTMRQIIALVKFHSKAILLSHFIDKISL